ncbi:hypothetical protein [Candidatus Pelagibacter sp.]|uniref:hypothetical protein n=1 Tax=Candidatus Pelagibacter sp. TaxID=2024849 RepID=UPI003F82FA2E
MIVYFFPNNTNANIFQTSCKSKKNSTVWVYSKKRNQMILTKINNSKTKVSFSIDRKTETAFMAKGEIDDLVTTINFDEKKGDLAMLQTALRGSNQFYKCSAPKVIKAE